MTYFNPELHLPFFFFLPCLGIPGCQLSIKGSGLKLIGSCKLHHKRLIHRVQKELVL